MREMPIWRRYVRFLGSNPTADVQDELDFHLSMRLEDLMRDGMSEAEARAKLQREFGDVEAVRRELEGLCRKRLGRERRARWWDSLGQDLRFAGRTLRKSPGFALLAILTLALGIGANTAVFSAVNGTLLRPLPYGEPDRIVVLHELNEGGGEAAVTGGNFLDWQRENRTYEAMALHWNPAFVPLMTILGANTAVRTRVTGVSQDFFRTMGVAPEAGRAFLDAESRRGGPAVMLVSHSFWRSHLGKDPAVLGRVLQWEGDGYEIVGVMPPGFGYPADTDVWVPAERDGITLERTAHNYSAVGRLREGVTASEGREDLNRITAALREQHGSAMDAVAVGVTPLQEELVGDLRQPLFLLLGASVLVLLVACTNLASSFLARASGREREIAVRSALGASRGRVIRQLLTESLVLSLLGAAVGVTAAVAVLQLLVGVGPASLTTTGGIGLDGRVLGFALLTALLTTFLFGLLPALRASDRGLGEALRAGTRGNAGGHRGRIWGALVGTEVALAIVLLVGSGLLIRSFQEVLGIDPGFDPRRVLTIDVSLPSSKYADDREKAAFYQQVLGELEQIPGVEDAGLIQHLPFGGMAHNGSFDVEGRGNTHELGLYPGYRVASRGYFQAMGIPLLRGRMFEESDDAGTGDVALVNQTLADSLWPGEDPIGARVRNLANDSWLYPDRWVTIVGVVGDVRHAGPLSAAEPEIYVHYLQRPNRAQSSVITLRTAVPPASVIGAARARILQIDPDVPAEFATMSARLMDSVADRRFTMLVLGAFALVALLLAAVGIYGVVSYSVARRTREIGIRLALGAQPGAVRSLVQRNAMLTTALGAAAGITGAFLVSRVLRGLLYGVSPTDPSTFAAVVLVLLAVAWVASYIPARRTTRVDPIITMRAD